MTDQPLAGKLALVTGGARRIGRAIALRLAAAGADVAFTYNRSQAESVATARAIAALGREVLAVSCDLRAEESIRAMIAAVHGRFGRIDLLVNSAGVFTSAPFEEIATEIWDAHFATNARAPFLVAREAAPYLRASRGRIINLTSLGATHAWATHAHYCASKAALEMLTRSMAKALAPEVSANCVAPGWIDVDEEGGELAARFAAKTPMQRNGRADEVAEAVLFFATGPHFITGQTLAVDGGLGL